MRVKILRSIAAVCAVLCLGAGNASPAGDDPLVRELDALGAKINRAMMDGDFEVMLSYYAADAVLMPNGEAMLVGKGAIRARLLENRKAGIVFHSFTGRVEEAWECGGLAYMRGTYALAASAPGLERPVADKGKSLSVLRRTEDGRLLVILDIWNTDVPPGM
jgi:ketosteroid isomerase-like protein